MSQLTHLVGKRVGNKRIKLIALLGEGSYGAVYHGLMRRSGLRKSKHCAVKVLRTDVEEHLLLCQRRELDLHRKVNGGDGVVTLYETFREGSYQFIVMRFCPDRDLWHGINRGRYLGNDALIKNTFMQILDATEHCHSHSVYHRDIKPENILLCDGGHTALLADFGLATDEPKSTATCLGSPRYMSPECWGDPDSCRSTPYATAPTDVWALGILLINLSCGRNAPWNFAHKDDRFFNDFIKQPDLLRLFVPVSQQLHTLLARVFVLDPAARISIKGFKIAINSIEHFGISPSQRTEYHDYQRAVWNSTVGVPLSSRLASPKVASSDPITHGADPPASTVDGNTSNLTQEVPSVPSSLDIPEVDSNLQTVSDCLPLAVNQPTRAHPQPLLPSSSSSSSIETNGPITPEMRPTIPDIDIPDISDPSDDSNFCQLMNAVAPPFALPTVKERPPSNSSWQGILDAIKAL